MIDNKSVHKASSVLIPADSKQAQQMRLEIANTHSTGSLDEEIKDDFALLDEETDGMTMDRKLIIIQMRGLFNSIPIKIDEKGYLIQLMHVYEMRQ